MVDRRREIDDLAQTLDSRLWVELVDRLEAMVASLTRWYVRHPREEGISDRIRRDRTAFAALEDALLADPGSWRSAAKARYERLCGAGVAGSIARHQAVAPILASAPDLIEVASAFGRDPLDVLDVFLRTGRMFGLDRIGELASGVEVATSWDRWAMWSIEEDLLALRRFAAEQVLAASAAHPGVDAVETFVGSRPAALARMDRFFSSLESADPDIASLTVALRQVRAAIA